MGKILYVSWLKTNFKNEAKMTKKDLTIQKVMNEQNQTHETRKRLYLSLEKLLQMPVISYFTSFNLM